MVRRLGMVAALALAVSLMPVAALADAPVEDLIIDGGTSDYSGRGMVMTAWGGDTAASVFTVTRSKGMAMVTAAGGTLAVGNGVVARNENGAWYGLTIAGAAPWAVSDRYTLRQGLDVTQLDRPARQYTILENGFPRIRIVVDVETSVPLRTEVLDGSGRVFRASFLTELSPMAPVSSVQQRDSGPMPDMVDSIEMASAASSVRLPESIGAYDRADAYAGPAGTVHAYYTDGLFSFSVFESSRTATPEAFDAAVEMEISGDRYRRIVEPSRVWLQWHAPDHTYVLVGDLPPDHLDVVVDNLPEPGNRGLLIRLWRRLFG